MTRPDHKEAFRDLLNRAAKKSAGATDNARSVARKPRGAVVDTVEATDEHDHERAEVPASKTGPGMG